jgi:hypothetical protein
MLVPLNVKEALVWTSLKFIIFAPLNIRWSIFQTQDIKGKMFRPEILNILRAPNPLKNIK